MDPVLVALSLGALLAIATLLGVAWKKRQGRVSRNSGSVLPPDIPRELIDPEAPFTLVQFSGPFCSYCDAMRRVLSAAVENNGGLVAHREIDITDYIELTSALAIRQTPTTLVVSNTGHIISRIHGAAQPPVIQTEIDTARDARKAQSDEYLI
jgi:thiol-disulfide isomerase/thioredoxin